MTTGMISCLAEETYLIFTFQVGQPKICMWIPLQPPPNVFFLPAITNVYQQMYIHDRIQPPHSSVCHFGFAGMSLLVPMVYGLKT